MITLKSIYKDGSEQVFEVKNFSYRATQNRIDAVDCDCEPLTIYLNDDSVAIVYAMNSRGATIGKYSLIESVGLRDYLS